MNKYLPERDVFDCFYHRTRASDDVKNASFVQDFKKTER